MMATITTWPSTMAVTATSAGWLTKISKNRPRLPVSGDQDTMQRPVCRGRSGSGRSPAKTTIAEIANRTRVARYAPANSSIPNDLAKFPIGPTSSGPTISRRMYPPTTTFEIAAPRFQVGVLQLQQSVQPTAALVMPMSTIPVRNNRNEETAMAYKTSTLPITPIKRPKPFHCFGPSGP